MGANICFDCIHAVPDKEGHGCSWSRKLEPVPGWIAEPSTLNPSSKYAAQTFHITYCPQFDPDRENIDRNGLGIKIQCIETGIIYNSLYRASLATGISTWKLSAAARDGTEIDGYHYRRVTP